MPGLAFVYQRLPIQKSTLTGRAASLRNAYFAIRVLNPASRPFARKPASGASVILAFCSTTPTGLKKRPVPNTRQICMNVSAMCFSIRTIRRSSKRRLNRASRKTSSTPPNGRRCTKWRWTGSWRFRCTRNTVPCRWSGTYRRYRPSSHTPTRAGCRTMAIFCRRWRRCVFRSSTCQYAQRGRYRPGHSGAKADDGDAPLHALADG